MAFRLDPPTITLDQIQWDEIGEEDPKTRLLAHIQIGDLAMHLEARQVVHSDDEHMIQSTIDYPEDHERMCDIADTTFQTLMIGDREYFVFALPYGN